MTTGEVGAAAGADEGSGTSSLDVTVYVDANTMAFGGSVAPPSYGLSELVSSLPSGAQSLLGWLPDIAIDAVGFMFDPTTDAVGVYVTAGLADSAKPSAELFIADVPVGGTTVFVVGMTLSSSLDLSGTPLFGSMLSGLSISNLGFSYASADVPAGAVQLPPPGPAHQPAYKQGPALSFTISDGTNSQDFMLTPSSGVTPTPTPAPTPARAGGPLALEAVSAGADPTDGPPVQWFPIEKTFGPLTLGRVGIVTSDTAFGLALDASVTTTSLGIDLVGFTVVFDPKSDISLDGVHVSLDGLAVDFSSGSLTLSGSLVRSSVEADDKRITEYDGSLMIQAGQYGISAVGAFADLDGSPSLFVFGTVEGQFGGVPAFFVTGIAAGFGYNRALRLPSPDQVQSFPLVLAATQGSGYLPDPGVQSALAKLNQGGWVPPELGSYWLAAGVKFTSFELIDAFALLIVQFGHEFVVALLGVAAIQLPKTGTAYAYAEMTLDAVLDPAQGTFQVTALLTPNSYVLYQDCHLTGGFAFYLWFGSNEHAGDFVVTLGGYNPSFAKPAWYPSVPRLGFDWNVSSDIHLQGGAYFALTPSSVMGGGGLSLTFQSGDLKAWFVAQADFIMYWKPFYFDVHIGVSIGASYTLNLWFTSKTLTVELSCDLELWGPPLAGVAHISWWVISFTIDINGGGSPSPPGGVVDWPTFQDSFLPAGAGGSTALTATADTQSSVCRPRAAAGLTGTITLDGQPVWVVSADALQLATETVIPSTQVVVVSSDPTKTKRYDGPQVGVYPMGSVLVTTTHQLTLLYYPDGSTTPTTEDLGSWDWTPVSGSLPQALWGLQNTGQPQLDSTVVPGIVGVTGVPPAPTLTGPPELALTALAYTDLEPQRPLPIPTTPAIDGSSPQPGADSRQIIQDTVASAAVVAERTAITSVLTTVGVGSGLTAGTLDLLAEEVFATFQASPMVGPVGSTGPRLVGPSTTAAQAVGTGDRAERPRAAAPARSLLAVFRHGPRAAAPARLAAVAHPVTRTRARAHVLDRHATAADRLLAAGHLDGDRQGRPAVTVHAGSSLLWHVAPAATVALEADGDLPVRVTAYDHQYLPLDDTVLPAGGGRYVVPRHAERLALTGLPAYDVVARDGAAAGWHGTSALLQVAPQALLAERAVVRPQSPHRLAIGRSSRDVGVVTGRRLVQRNWVESAAGRRPGRIETWLPAATRTVAVTLRPGGGPAGDRAPAEAGADVRVSFGGGHAPRRLAVTPVEARQLGDAVRLLYDVPGGPADGTVRVLVGTDGGWLLDGVLGLAMTPRAVPDAWEPSARTHRHDAGRTRVVFR